MKYATLLHDGQPRVARVEGASLQLLDTGTADVARMGVTALIGQTPLDSGETVALAGASLLAPVPRPHRNIFCVGKNYHAHAAEFAASGFDSSAAAGDVPKHPILFSKVPDCVVGPGEVVRIDAAVTEAVDYEAELAVIIGTGGRNIAAADAMSHVWGYTIVNDVTARDLQGRHSQWLIGKSQDSFCPMGPFAVTAGDLDLGDTRIRCRINGETRQDSNTRLLIFDVPAIIAALSNGITLMPGDVIATGTPEGVGIGFKPPRYLRPGDRMEVEVDGIGTLVSPVEAM